MIRSTNNNAQQLAQILAQKALEQVSTDEISEDGELICSESADPSKTEQGIRSEIKQSRVIDNLAAQLLQHQFLKMDTTTAIKRAVAQESQLPLSNLSAQIQNLAEHIKGLPESDPMLKAFQQLEMILSQAQDLSFPEDIDTRTAFDILGATGQTEEKLHEAISENAAQAATTKSETEDPIAEIVRQFAMMLSALQGRPGQMPLGYSPDEFNPEKSASVSDDESSAQSGTGNPAAQKERLEEAKKLKNSGALAGGESKRPKLSPEEQKKIDDRVACADDEDAERISNDPELLKKLSPEQKAKLIKQLMDGDTDGSQDCSIARICASVNSKEEWNKVTELAGGHLIFDELDNDQAKGWFKEAESKWINAENDAAKKAVELLEKCETREEAKELADELGGLNLKHQVKDPETLKRLEAVAKRFKMEKLGYGLPPEKVKEYREAFGRAAMYEDSGLAVRLSEDKDAMAVATPGEKAKLIKELQRGWTKDHQDAAVKRILLSCKTKEEFDELVQLAGGPAIMNDLDEDESKKKINQLMGAWGRKDLAEDPAVASQFENIFVDPQERARLTATREPRQDEIDAVGGEYKMDPNDANDPYMQAGNQAAGKVKTDMAKDMYSLDDDPQAQNELGLTQRERELNGQPKLDFTELTAEANKIVSAPDFENKVQEYAKNNDISDLKEAREKYLTQKMDHLRLKYGLSTQEMSGLVTKRMAHIYGKGAQQMNGYSEAIVAPLKQQLALVERTYGPNSPQAIALREQIAKVEKSTGAFTEHLGNVSDATRAMYPVPSSFWEDFVSSLGPIADIAAGVACLIPGVGTAIGAIYFGVKTAIKAAQGDVLGAFTSLASALPGVGGIVGGTAGTVLKTAGQVGQAGIGFGKGIAEGNAFAAMGSLAGVAPGVPAFDYARKGFAVADGINRGDVAAIAGGASGLLGPVANDPTIQNIIRNPLVQGVTQSAEKAVPFLEAIASGDASKALGAIANQLGPLAANNREAARLLGVVTDGAKFLDALRTGNYGQALGGLISNHELLNASPGVAGFVNSFGQVSDLAGALASGNPQQLANVLQGQSGFLQVIGGGGLSQALNQITDSANQTLIAPQIQTAFDLTRSGSRFLNAVGTGDLRSALTAIAGPSAATFSRMIAGAQPLIQSMARGDFQRVIEALEKNPLTENIANIFGTLQPFADLVQGDWQRSLEGYRNNLAELVELRNETEHFEKLEESARQLQQRFGQDYISMAHHLLQRAGYDEDEVEKIA